jgi:AAA domain
VPSLTPSDKWKYVYTLDDARTGVWQKPTSIISGLLLAQSALLVSAHPHSMKSLAWLQAALEAPSRKKVWEHFPTPNVDRTLFIETEDPPWLVQERIRGLAKGLGIEDGERIPGFHWVCPGPFDLVKDIRELAVLLDKVKPDFAVISTLQNIIPGRDLNEQRDMAPVNRAVITLARKFCPIVMVTHSTWDKSNKRALGTITQTANYATALHFEKSGDQVRVTLDSKLGSDEEEFSLHLETAESSYVDEVGVEQKKQEVRRLVYKPKVSPKKAKIVAAIRDLGDAASAQDIADKAGVSDRYVRRIKAEKKNAKKASSQRPSELASGGGKTVPPMVPPEVRAT